MSVTYAYIVSVGTEASESIHQTGIKGGIWVINIYSCISVALTLASLREKWLLLLWYTESRVSAVQVNGGHRRLTNQGIC